MKARVYLIGIEAFLRFKMSICKSGRDRFSGHYQFKTEMTKKKFCYKTLFVCHNAVARGNDVINNYLKRQIESVISSVFKVCFL